MAAALAAASFLLSRVGGGGRGGFSNGLISREELPDKTGRVRTCVAKATMCSYFMLSTGQVVNSTGQETRKGSGYSIARNEWKMNDKMNE